MFFSPSVGKAVASPAEGTSLVVVNAFYTTVINLSKFSDLGCKTGDSGSEGLQFCWNLFQVPRSVGKQLAKLCEAKSLESSGLREVTRRSVSWLMSG
ncbi:hypothetical protein Tco_0605561 [Tanacetum coccineum]